MPVISVAEAEIRRMKVQDQPGQKVIKTPISTNKLGLVAYACNPSHVGNVCWRLEAQAWPQTKMRDPIQKSNTFFFFL
jgi:hypothetical protein